MFGHRDDVISQDQKRDADVTLPESTLNMLVAPPAQGSSTDSPAPASSTPPATPSMAATSIDGFSAPAANLNDPLGFTSRPQAQNFIPQDDSQPQNDTQPAEPEVAMEPIELTHDAPAHDEYPEHLSDEQPHDAPVADSQPDQSQEPEANAVPEPEEASDTPKDTPANASGDLLQLKQAALQELSPLVDKLELNAEERFRTLMMLIQASDNQGLLASAHAAAREIEDEHKRAQALLDVVNEINYFTNTDTKN